jgi:hypothetical protein
LRTRQKAVTDPRLSPRQKRDNVIKSKNTVPELKNIPANYFNPNTVGEGLLGTGLLKSRPNIKMEYTDQITAQGKPLLAVEQKYSWFFLEYNNSNVVGLGDILKSFSIIKTLSPVTVKSCSEMLGGIARNITGISEEIYMNGYFYHPKYINDNGTPLQIRYAEIAIVRQKTPGRLDNVPIGYPDFDSTPDGVITRKGPLPSPPYTDFTSSTGATISVNVQAGGTVAFKDTTINTPWPIAPTGWVWDFGMTASPTGSTAQNPIVAYGTTGAYTVTLTASNAAGSKSKTRVNFIIVN